MNRRHIPKRPLRAALLALVLVGGIGYSSTVVWQHIKPETKIGATPQATVKKVLGEQTKTKPVTAGRFTLELPQDWEAFKLPDLPDTAYSWRNTVDNKGARIITLYTGILPREMAVNRVLAVETDGDKLLTKGSVSENCVNFVSSGRERHSGGGREPARWEGVQFICDTGNYSRNVVGLSSEEGTNLARLNGPSGPRDLFMTYTDANLSPNHNAYVHAVETLRVK